MRLVDVTSYLDDYLRLREVPDAPGALNGLELDLARLDRRKRLNELLGSTPRLMAFGPARTGRVGIVTGGAGSLIGQAAAAGLDTYITGEGAHHTYFDAEELGLNVFYAGHYATETVGVKALAEHVHRRFGLPWVFLDHPTGL